MLLAGGGRAVPAYRAESGATAPRPAQANVVTAGPQRLTYDVTFLGIAVARALIDQVPGGRPDGSWLIRGASRTTGFWEQFFHIRNDYLSVVHPGDFLPSVYQRRVDQTGLRFVSTDHYTGSAAVPGEEGARVEPLPGAESVPWPALPERDRQEGDPERAEVSIAMPGEDNLFSALWWVRYTDWDRVTEGRRTMRVDGLRWELTAQKKGTERLRVLGDRLDAWEVLITMRRLDPKPEPIEGEEREKTDYVTQELVRENAEITFWVERAPARRPLRLVVKRPGLTVKAQIREPYDDEMAAWREGFPGG